MAITSREHYIKVRKDIVRESDKIIAELQDKIKAEQDRVDLRLDELYEQYESLVLNTEK